MYKLSCHCQAVAIELNLPDDLENLCRCNCSMCKRRGTIVAIVDQDNLRVVQGEDKLFLYQFHTNTAKHYFCSVCGIYTHHQTRINTSKYGVNVACIDGINPVELENVKDVNGMNHPLDK